MPHSAIVLAAVVPTLLTGHRKRRDHAARHRYARCATDHSAYDSRNGIPYPHRHNCPVNPLFCGCPFLCPPICIHDYETVATDTKRTESTRRRRTFARDTVPVDSTVQLVRENRSLRSRLSGKPARDTVTRVGAHPQATLVRPAGSRPLYRGTMVQSCRLAAETRVANRT